MSQSEFEQQGEVGVFEGESPSTSNPQEHEAKKVEDKRLTELNGEIGYFVKKGMQFVPMTNFSVICTGYVTENPESGSSDGFLFQVVPKNTFANGEEGNQRENRTQYYLTWRDMSTQTGILSKFNSQKLWTVPAKDQYLPAYFKGLCDQYLKESNPRRVYPVECIGLQERSVPPTWVIGSNFHVQMVGGVSRRLSSGHSPYAVLGSELTPLPFINVEEEDLDYGTSLKNIITIQSKHMGDNFAPALLVIGGLGLVLHYQILSELYDGVPLVMAYGLPVSGKSLAVQIAMSVIGEDKSIGECTQAGLLKLACSRSLPFWWDDVSDFDTLESLVVQAFNQSQKQTARQEKASQPRSTPLMTMNPHCLYRKKRVNKEKISRVFSRIATIPFQRISQFQTLQGSLQLRASLQPALRKAILSVGTLLELEEDFKSMREDVLFHEINPLLEKSQLDMRTQLNYALLLFSTGKILEKLCLLEHFETVKDYFTQHILPVVSQLLQDGEDTIANSSLYSDQEEEEYISLMTTVVQECSSRPQEAKSFFLAKTSMKSKCKCGDVFGFKVSEALNFIKKPEREQALKRFITTTKRGCAGRLTFPGTGQVSGCLHIQRVQLPEKLLKSMDEAFLIRKNVPAGCSRNLQLLEEADEAQPLPAPAITIPGDNDVPANDPELEVTEVTQGAIDDVNSDEEKMALDEEILQRGAEKAEAEAKIPSVQIQNNSTAGQQDNKSNRKGGRSKVANLYDNLHPGTVSGKRRRTNK